MNSRRFGALFVIELVLAAALVLLAAQLLSDSAEKSPPIRPEVPTEDSPSTGLGGPIEKVVDIVKENRTFDNMFGRYPGPDGAPTGRYFERLRGSPETDSRSLPARHRPQLPSRAHGVNGGDMNGFDLIPGGRDFAFTQYRRGDVPAYWAYADNFVLRTGCFRRRSLQPFPSTCTSSQRTPRGSSPTSARTTVPADSAMTRVTMYPNWFVIPTSSNGKTK